MSALLIQKFSVYVQVFKNFPSTVKQCLPAPMNGWSPDGELTKTQPWISILHIVAREITNICWWKISSMHPKGLPKRGLPDFWGRLVSGLGCRQERPGASSVGTAEPGRPDNGTAGIPPPINRLPWGHGHQGAAQVSAPRWKKSGGRLGANLPSRWTL